MTQKLVTVFCWSLEKPSFPRKSYSHWGLRQPPFHLYPTLHLSKEAQAQSCSRCLATVRRARRTAETVSLSNWTVSDRNTVPPTSCYVGEMNLGFSKLLLLRYCTTCSWKRGSLIWCLTHNSCLTWPWIVVKPKPEKSKCKNKICNRECDTNQTQNFTYV